ncbi:short-chain dehydrogenase [Kitasatospora sp. MMS16-BH015]|uniref:SDR family NAD(P)-dependent oxidoreductase n=1 Tax=Kitasatospora sp. MMS16-BH015 TaxID=2018025 RepID=UPI000CA2F912|nr:SDR family NAD(P)-dependent oxidoreductase [Kitasatospora sp. MMS16-BH015]AUG81541.1 short-chain dehydrogenase [Kitasatospora sp. MMS16-BH015]
MSVALSALPQPSAGSAPFALVTGASSGIGWETARLLAGHGATVLVHARTAEEAEGAVERLAARGVARHLLLPVAADFTRLAAVRELAETVARTTSELHLLVNNAAIMAPERCTLTEDGIEVSFQVNFLAAHVLADLLREPLTAAGGARIVNVSSSLARTASMNWNDPNRAKKYSRVAAYAQSQLALSIDTQAMAPEGSGITAVSVNPGLCDTALLPLYGRVGAPPAEGAQAVVRLCLPQTRLTNGEYYDGGDIAPTALAVHEDRSQRRLGRLAELLATQA